MPFDIEGARSAGYTDAEIAGFLGQQSGFDVAAATRAGYQPAEIVGFLSQRSKAADETPADESDPLTRVSSSTPRAQQTFTATDNLPRSVLDKSPAQPGEFNLRNASAARNALDDPRLKAPSLKASNPTPVDPNIARGAAFAGASLPVRAAAKVATGGAQGIGGLVRAAGDVAGLPAVSEFGAAAGRGGRAFDQGMGQTGQMADFGPNSPLPYLTDMAEGAASSLGQSAIYAGALGARAVIPALSLQSAGQEYDQARQAGMEPAAAFAGAIPKGIFEAVGEKFTGLDRVAASMGTLLTRGVSDAAKRQAGDELRRLGIREIPGEVITYLGQTGTDLIPGIGLKQDLTMRQFIDGLRDTVVQAGMMGVAAGGGGALLARGEPAQPQVPSAQDLIRAHWGPTFAEAAAPDAIPIAQIAQAQSVDAAISAAAAAIKPVVPRETAAPPASSPEASAAVDNIESLLAAREQPTPAAINSEASNVSTQVAADAAVQPGAGSRGVVDAAGERAGGLLDRGAGGVLRAPAADAGGSSPAGVLPDGGGQPRAVAPGITATMNPTGTLSLVGDAAVIRAKLADFGIKAIPFNGGMLVGRSQAQQAQAVFQVAGEAASVLNSDNAAANPQAIQAAPAQQDGANLPGDGLSAANETVRQGAGPTSPDAMLWRRNGDVSETAPLLNAGNETQPDSHGRQGAEPTVGRPGADIRAAELGAATHRQLENVGGPVASTVAGGARTDVPAGPRVQGQSADVKSPNGHQPYRPDAHVQNLRQTEANPAATTDGAGEKGVTASDGVAARTGPSAGQPQEQRNVAGQATSLQAPSPEGVSVSAQPQTRFPRVDSIPHMSVGPSSVTVKPIAEGKRLYRETNADGLDTLMRSDAQFDVGNTFVTDNPDLALGQGENKGVMIQFRPDSLSGRENRKPGTGDIAGREFIADVRAPRAIERVTFAKADTALKVRGLTRRFLKQDFTQERLPDGRIQFTRKGLEAQQETKTREDTAPQEQVAPFSRAPATESESFKRTETADATDTAGPLPVTEVQAIVKRLSATWTNGPKLHVVANHLDLGHDTPKDVRGLYSKGQAWVVARKHRTVAEVASTLAHEVIAHYGLRDMLGREDWAKMMANIQLALKSGNKPLGEIRDYVRRAYVDEKGAFYLSPAIEADEIAARAVELAIDPKTGEFNPGFSFLKSVWAKVAMFLRAHGFEVTFTNAELQGMLVLSMHNLEAGKKTAGGGDVLVAAARDEGPVAARGGDQTDTPAFRKWFGDSKVVDADGKPLRVFHGTNKTADGEAFTMFDAYGSNYGLFGQGAYFTENAEVASSYVKKGRGDAPTVYAVYMNLLNPIDMDVKADPAAWREAFDDIDFDVFPPAGDTNEAFYRAAEEDLTDQQIPRSEGAEIMQDGLRKMGHDGITHIGGGRVKSEGVKHRVYIAFDPEQIKSATGNNGNFDPFDVSIVHARGDAANATRDAADAAPPDKTSPWRDGTGRLHFAPGQWLYDKLGDAAGPLLAKVGMKAASPELRRQLRAMKLAVAKAQETAAAVAGEAMKLSQDEREMVSDLIEQEMRAGTVPPEHAVRLAALINSSMGTQTDELVRLGMLTKESADQWRGKYLPRYYKSKLKGQALDLWAQALSKMMGRQRVMAGIKGKHLRGRGLFETINEAQIPDYEALGWEIRDPDYKAGEGDGTVQVWRDFTRDERDKMGEIRDSGFRFVMGYMQTQRDIAMGRLFEGLANDAGMSAKRESEKFNVQVPDGTVPGTGAKRYGKLAGRWVSKEVMSHLSQIEESQSEAWRMYRQAMGIWKEGKTALNPVSHVNNILSNLTMAHFAGVSYHRADKYIAAARDFATSAPGIKEAKEAGLFLGTMSDAELLNVLPEDLKALVREQDGAAKKIGRTAFNVMTFYLRRPMGWAYQAEDTFFRYLLYKDARDQGMEAQDAVDHAQRYIFTYDDLPKGARMIRDFGIPFFSYTYKAAPALLHTAMTHPVRMAAPAALLWAANAAAYAIAVGDDDDSWDEKLKKYLTDASYREKARAKEKLEREHLPPWMKGTTSLLTPKTLRLGMDELTKLPLFIDISRIIPGGDLFDVSPNAGGIPLPQPITPSHPLFTTAVAMLGNKDMFFGKDLVDSNDTTGEATQKRMDWLWTQLSPAIAIGNYHFSRGMNALAQASGGEIKWLPDAISENYTGIGKDGNPVQGKYAAMQTFGIKVRPIDIDTAEEIEGNLRNKMLRDIDTELKKMQRLNSKGAVSDKVMDKEREKAILKKDRIRDGLTVDGNAKD